MPHDHYHSPGNNHTDDHFRHVFHPPVLHVDLDILLFDIICVPNYNNYSPSNNHNPDDHFRHLFNPPVLRFL
jgi:hypothetical protein